MSLLNLKDVSMVYGGRVTALENVNLTVEKGDWLAIMGPSGSGKTTLMNIVGCMDTHTSGEVILDGINLGQVTKSELTRIRRDKVGMDGISTVSPDSLFDCCRKSDGCSILSQYS